MACISCKKVYTSIQFVYTEVRRNGQGFKSVARLLESGEIRVFLDVGPQQGELERLEELDQGELVT